MNAADALPPWPAEPALFVDLDGTLLEIAEHPDDVSPSARLAGLLPQLPAATGGAVAIVTGRSMQDVDQLLGCPWMAIAGIHGLERRDAHGDIHRPAGVDLPLWVRQDIKAFIEQHAGLWLENKTVSLAIHYRSTQELEPDVRLFADDLRQHLPSDVELLHGRKILEIKPAAMNKGEAIRAFMAEAPFTGRTPVYVGDDLTDEAGFAAVEDYAGVAVKVGNGPTRAAWRLEGVTAVLDWIEGLTRRAGL